ncbi:hypothetical protein A4G20_00570 [Pasteurellaceae bacterium RH1A]|nr:hypothetical protein A4G20_00570 [Pasteurellaceae bacterium RH1A]
MIHLPVHPKAQEIISDPVSDPVTNLLYLLEQEDLGTAQLMKALNISHRSYFRKAYLQVGLDLGLIVMTLPDKPNSRNQKYHLTSKGKQLLQQVKER